MSEVETATNETTILLMLSGGRDSFLAACELVSEGFCVHLITYDNGRMSQVENVKTVVNRLRERFGNDKIKFAGIHIIAQSINPLLKKALYTETFELCREYPHLLTYQLNCLACHTAMYFHSLAYCQANGICYLSEGAREEQNFFVELPEMAEKYRELCKKYHVHLKLPVYELKSDAKRKEELADWGLTPKTYEPQCWVGCPMECELTKEERESLALYFDKEMKPKAESMIENLIRKKKIYCESRTSTNGYL